VAGAAIEPEVPVPFLKPGGQDRADRESEEGCLRTKSLGIYVKVLGPEASTTTTMVMAGAVS